MCTKIDCSSVYTKIDCSSVYAKIDCSSVYTKIDCSSDMIDLLERILVYVPTTDF